MPTRCDNRRTESLRGPAVDVASLFTVCQRSCGKLMFSVMLSPLSNCIGPLPTPLYRDPVISHTYSNLLNLNHSPIPPTCSNLFVMKHELSERGRLALTEMPSCRIYVRRCLCDRCRDFLLMRSSATSGAHP